MSSDVTVLTVTILVSISIYRRLLINRDGYLEQSEATIYRDVYENTGPDRHLVTIRVPIPRQRCLILWRTNAIN